MKRFAAHYLYFSLTEKYFKGYVELSEGKVIKAGFLNQELESTVWLNGSILLSPILFEEVSAGLTFRQLFTEHPWDLSRFAEENIHLQKIYAYYISSFDTEDILDLYSSDFLLLSD